MKNIQYRFIRSANADLNVIWESIALDNPEAADRLTGEIYERVQLLAKFVRLGHARPDLVGQRPVLFSAIRKYLIVYEVKDGTLVVLAVRIPRATSPQLCTIVNPGHSTHLQSPQCRSTSKFTPLAARLAAPP